MRDDANEFQKAFWGSTTSLDEPVFDEVWPTETRGDGVLRPNNLRTGAAQGKSSMIRKAPCRLCGWLNDLVAVDHSGGSIDGLGAGGGVTTSTGSAPVSSIGLHDLSNGKHTENFGTQSPKKNAGCALCFSKNSTGMRVDVSSYVDPWDKISLTGF